MRCFGNHYALIQNPAVLPKLQLINSEYHTVVHYIITNIIFPLIMLCKVLNTPL
jgi:hypothetical protein